MTTKRAACPPKTPAKAKAPRRKASKRLRLEARAVQAGTWFAGFHDY